MKELKQSPRPQRVEKAGLGFPAAMKLIIDGNTITKREWNSGNIYGVLKDGFLMLHKEDGKFYQWIISEGDLKGEDYIVCNLPITNPN
jgi:hypothetical protein